MIDIAKINTENKNDSAKKEVAKFTKAQPKNPYKYLCGQKKKIQNKR